MPYVVRYFSVRVSEIARRTVLEVLVEVHAKKLLNFSSAYIYMVEGEQNCEWIERCLRQIVGSENYLRFDTLPPSFREGYTVSDVIL